MFSIRTKYDFQKSAWVKNDMSPIDDIKWEQSYNIYPRKNDRLRVIVGT